MQAVKSVLCLSADVSVCEIYAFQQSALRRQQREKNTVCVFFFLLSSFVCECTSMIVYRVDCRMWIANVRCICAINAKRSTKYLHRYTMTHTEQVDNLIAHNANRETYDNAARLTAQLSHTHDTTRPSNGCERLLFSIFENEVSVRDYSALSVILFFSLLSFFVFFLKSETCEQEFFLLFVWNNKKNEKIGEETPLQETKWKQRNDKV